jgi:hypothetical protein
MSILGGIPLVFQTPTETTIYYFEDAVEVIEVDPIPFPPNSATEEKVVKLSINASEPVVALPSDGPFDRAGDDPLVASISNGTMEILKIRFKVIEGTAGNTQELEFYIASTTSKVLVDFEVASRTLDERDKVLSSLRKYLLIFTDYKSDLMNANNQENSLAAGKAANKKMRDAAAEVDDELKSLGSDIRGVDYVSKDRAEKTRGVQAGIDKLEKEIARRNVQVKETREQVGELREKIESARVILEKSKDNLHIFLLSEYEIPIAKFKLDLDLGKLNAAQ